MISVLSIACHNDLMPLLHYDVDNVLGILTIASMIVT